jgi:hypothetical protein
MEKWFGAAGKCLNNNTELLMVLQGKTEEVKTWSIPSGGLEANVDSIRKGRKAQGGTDLLKQKSWTQRMFRFQKC